MDLHGLITKHEQQEDLIVIITLLRTMPAKLYYTSFWDKFGMDINYFGMYPKT